MSRKNIDVLIILNEARKCIMQNTNMNEHCIYTINQIERAQDLVKKLTIPDVSQQRELLLAWEEYCCKLEYLTPNYEVLEENINDFLANNCG